MAFAIPSHRDQGRPSESAKSHCRRIEKRKATTSTWGPFDGEKPLDLASEEVRPPKPKTFDSVTGRPRKAITEALTLISRPKIFEMHLLLEINDERERDVILNMEVGTKRRMYEIERLQDSETFTATGTTDPLKRFCLTKV